MTKQFTDKQGQYLAVARRGCGRLIVGALVRAVLMDWSGDF
jgi:hypothetical protein